MSIQEHIQQLGGELLDSSPGWYKFSYWGELYYILECGHIELYSYDECIGYYESVQEALEAL